MALNKVMLIGNVGNDPEIRYLDSNPQSPQGNAKVASFRLATTERYRDRNGETHENTEWHNIVAWRNNADLVERFVHKGSQLFIEGKLRTRQWTDQSGNKRFTTEIQVDNIQLLGKRPDGQQGQPAGPQQGYAGQQPQGGGYQGSGYGPSQGGYPAQQPGYNAQPQGGYQNPGYAPSQGGYPAQQGGYATQQPGHGAPQGGYAGQQPGHDAPQGGYAAQPAPQPAYSAPVQPHAPQPAAPASDPNDDPNDDLPF